jgi:chromate transport protein ChrA
MWRVFDGFVFEPMHFVMERRMMIGLKQLAERQSRERTLNHLQSAFWILTFGLTVAAVVSVFRRTSWARALVGFAAAAVVFQILTLAQPPIVLGAVLLGLVAAICHGKGSGVFTKHIERWQKMGRIHD